ncbi:MAG: glycosyltransferase family 4 protein [Bacteroidota bacterium]|nr:glycosyltransferase family 4 protein [Bacteroidota bacterium]
MKIVVIETIIDGPIIGGGNLYLPGLIKGLVQNGHEVHLVVKGTPNVKVLDFINESGAIIHDKPWKKKGLVTDLAPVLAEWVNQLSPDIYLISGSYDIGWLALPFIDPGIATFATAHSNTDNYYYPAKHYKDFITIAIGVSDEICKNFNEVSKIDKEKIEWIPYGIKPSTSLEERTDVEPLHIIFAGRLEEYLKRISDVKEIIKKLAVSDIKYHFQIIGDGSEYLNIKKDLSAEIAKGNVEMLGWVPGDKVLEALKNSDVFILTSSSEGFSISLIEAMANGCCPVVTDIPSGSIQLIESNKNGFLIPVGGLEKFVERLVYLYGNKTDLLRMRKAAWEVGKKFSVERMVDAYINCFKKGISIAGKDSRQINKKFPVMQSTRSKYPRWLRRIKYYLFNETGFSQ